MITALRSVWVWTGSGLLILLWLPIMAISRLFERSPYYRTGFLFRKLGHTMTMLNPLWTFERTGTIPSNPNNPYIVVSNHLSNADIPSISRLPWEMKWIGKKSLFDMPVAGWLMKLAGDIAVDRGDKRSRANVLIQGRKYLQENCSLMFFPEGTRSRDGRVLGFTDGAFRIAIKTKLPILPLAIDGTQNALPKNSWKFTSATQVRLHVFDPIPTDGLTAADAPELRERVRQQIIAQLAQWRGVAATQVDALTGKDSANTSAATDAGSA
ncbi:MAG: lysophospholipid acyltransferase family protein [Bacteroidota bacterium]